MEIYQEHDDARGSFIPTTPRGKTRFEMQNRGPMRPGKTRNDKANGSWYQRLSNRTGRSQEMSNA